MTQVLLRRVYDDPSPAGGLRVLVDRVWPRGLTKDAAHLDAWIKGAVARLPPVSDGAHRRAGCRPMGDTPTNPVKGRLS